MKIKSLALGVAGALALGSSAFAERGSDGNVGIIYWQAPSILNPYLSGGTKDIESSSMVIEALAGYDNNGAMFPRLVTEVPTVSNGGISSDLTSITWNLTPGILWSDGTPLTSDDVLFTYDYCMGEPGCYQEAKFEGVSKVEALDDLTIKITFDNAMPVPYGPFVGSQTPILQKAQFENCTGTRRQECTDENFGPIGTGPFVVTEFKPNDVIQLKANPNYRDPSKPAFASMVFKGGGDAAAAGRAVMETGEYDYGWNLQLAPEVISQMAEAGKGVPIAAFGTAVERLEMNMTDPSSSLDADTRSTRKALHPFLSDIKVRKALSMAIDRKLLTEIGYGVAGTPTCNLVPGPKLFASDNTDCLTQDIAGANALLDEAGWTVGGDGVRIKDGMRLSILYITSTNAVRQDYQALIKDMWSQIGVETELRNLNASVFFGGDPASPDTYQKFYADVEMYTNVFDGTDPQAYLSAYRCGNEPRPENGWQGENINRYCDPAYDALLDELTMEANTNKRGEIARKLNDMLTKDSYTIVPLTYRGRVSARSNTLGGVVLNTWDTELWNVEDWHRTN